MDAAIPIIHSIHLDGCFLEQIQEKKAEYKKNRGSKEISTMTV